jgi:uncharacterized phage-like protein YoqJ
MKNKNKRCVISGIDVSFLPFGYNEDSAECQKAKNELLSAIITLHRQGVDEFYTDCGFGFPLWGGEIVTGLMRYNDIMLYTVLPYENQPYKYTHNWQDRFYKVHELCTDVIPMYLEGGEIDDSFVFSHESDEELVQKGCDYMLADCGRLLFCGNGQGSYIYEQAVKLGRSLTVVPID